MSEKTKKILIVGDVAIDHFYHPVPGQDHGDNWQLYPALQTSLLPGGAFVLTKFVREAISTTKIATEVIGHKIPKNLNGKDALAMIQAKIMLASFKEKEKVKDIEKETNYIRVGKYQGYTSPIVEKTEVAAKEENISDVDLLVLDDAGNGFRSRVNEFPKSIDNINTMVVYKMSLPLAEGKLWEKVSARKGDWILILQAKDIRMCNNVQLSKALSWERTAMEMAYQLKRNASLAELQKAPYKVILFGNDGALFVTNNPDEKPLLIFDPNNLEGGYSSSFKGLGISTGAAFAASLSSSILEHGIGGIVLGIKNGLSAMRNLYKNGFVEKNNVVDYTTGNIFTGEKHNFSECLLETFNDLYTADPVYWRIMDEKTKLSKPLITVDIVKNKNPKILNEIPVGIYSKMQTFDRSEIEQYNSIKNLIIEFLNDPKTSRPLCLAVFGPPGAGKSFGIKQLLSSLGRNDIPTMTFNISQYASYTDLVADFHKVRDKVLTGAIPVAFFDEFDSDKDNLSMGWLKYFLCPMQDGEFKEGEAIHPIGKSIFVFAGGTRSSFADFEQNISSDSGKKNIVSKDSLTENSQKRMEQFRNAKGPDFVSRLRGFIDILGPNPNHQSGKIDNTFIIRRAKILRVTFDTTEKTKQLFNSKKELQIDKSVLRAMLNIPEYKHGNRSMSAILDMSRLTDKTKFDLSALPTPDQLDIHVDAKFFMWLAANERFYSLLPVEERFELDENSPIIWEEKLIEKIAEKIHNDYYDQRCRHEETTSSVVLWSELPNDKKKSNLDAATDIPVKLEHIGFGITKIKNHNLIQTPDISDEEIEMLAEKEHERWCREQTIQGWRYGDLRNNVEKTHPSMVNWNKLTEAEKDKDRQAIYALPRILKEVGYSIYRIEAYDAINDNLTRQIAVSIHEDYCRNRVADGKTKELVPNLVSFDELSDEIKEANYDSARTIPRKLKLLNIELQRSMIGTEPELLVFTNDEIETLSKWEHTRWNWQKLLNGWIYGEKRDDAKKINPSILPWSNLPDDIKEYDRQSVRLIPGIIKSAGYRAVRIDKKAIKS